MSFAQIAIKLDPWLVPLLTRDNPTYPASGVNDITITSWDQVYVYVEGRLTC